MNVLHLHSDLEYRGSLKESVLLARHLTGACVDIACLGCDGPGGAMLRSRGAEPILLDWTRAFDPTPLWRLRRLLRERKPDRIHVWDLKALRTLALVARSSLRRTVVSLPSPWRRKLGAVDRWLLGRVGRLVVRSESEGAAWAALGVSTARMSRVAPGVETGTLAEAPGSPRHFLAVGPLTATKGLMSAVYALDILAQVDADLSLDVVGEGPVRRHLEESQVRRESPILARFLGRVPSLDESLQRAGMVWAPSAGSGCTHTVLEAMAAARPVIATAWPNLGELVAEGETGFLVPVGHHLALARRTWQLLNEPDSLRRMGIAARQRVQSRFPVDRFLEGVEAAYRVAG